MEAFVREERITSELSVVFRPEPRADTLLHPLSDAAKHFRAVAVVEVRRPAPNDAIDPL